jgi:hypothetical protein
MAMDQNLRDHQSWIGYLQPEGLVVSAAALVDSQASLDLGQAAGRQIEFKQFVEWIPNPIVADQEREPQVYAISSLQRLMLEFLNWPSERILGLEPSNPVPEQLKIPLRDFGETLEPTYAFVWHVTNEEAPSTTEPSQETAKPWMLLVQELPIGTRLDVPVDSKLSGWSASPTRRFERLLREAEVPIGLLTNSTHIQLIYAPRGENSGTINFPVAAMTEISGRPILAAFHMLLSRYRLLAAPTKDRLPGLLQRSRDYQVRVSNALAKQVLEALYELLRGFQSADDMEANKLLEEVLKDNPDRIYNGLLSVLMRLVFLLYAEDQGLMPDSDVYTRHYSVHGLFQRLRNDAEQFPDTMEHRFGGWAQLLALFRLVYQGSRHKLLQMPAREGHLFDPARYPFLEGRSNDPQYDPAKPLRLPLVPDGTVYRVLEKLLVLEGERLSYRTLDVEQIGSVYETMIGFHLQRATGVSIALKPGKSHGAPVPVNLEELLQIAGDKRKAAIKEQTDYEPTTKMAAAVKSAESTDDLLIALESRIARSATPQPVSAGTMLLVPSDERRRSGSHYTPRSLTEPIVRTTLEPILRHLGEQSGSGELSADPDAPLPIPTPNAILDLKFCDPAMGSGAFLVEACRQLAEALVDSWAAHGYKPYIPPDEDELLHARRLVAQRCLYGVDRNPMAVDLAKLSLWLATLAKDHPFTFVDHTLRCGDSLVGLTRKQIVGFDLNPSAQLGFVEKEVRDRMINVGNQRRMILDAGDNMLPGMKLAKLKLADEQLSLVRLAGNAVVAAFFGADSPKKRKVVQTKHFESLEQWIQKSDFLARRELDIAVTNLTNAKDSESSHAINPFHWEIEFPEVFATNEGGFDALVGNPPFAGKNTLIQASHEHFVDWLKLLHPGSNGSSDLIAHFFRRAYSLIKVNGVIGFIATNTVSQGDTRICGLSWICKNGGRIYSARKRIKWPGVAAVVVSAIHLIRGDTTIRAKLDGRPVEKITAFLFHAGNHETPVALVSNTGIGFKGTEIGSLGFLVDKSDQRFSSFLGVADPRAENTSILKPYFGGEELNTVIGLDTPRYVLDCDGLPAQFFDSCPHVLERLEVSVRPDFLRRGEITEQTQNWWNFRRPCDQLRRAWQQFPRLLCIAIVSRTCAFTFLPAYAFANAKLVVFRLDRYQHFAVMQSRIHEVWARQFCATMKDDLQYALTDCFENYPLPRDFESIDPGCQTASLEDIGKDYFDFRASIMHTSQQGLTALYNRFHDPNEDCPEIQRLRALHYKLDCAVLNAYGWSDLAEKSLCEFLLDYEDEDISGEETPARRRKPWRLRWPDEFRDEVLAKLLELNEKRAADERRSGSAAEKSALRGGTRKKVVAKKVAKPTPLLDQDGGLWTH